MNVEEALKAIDHLLALIDDLENEDHRTYICGEEFFESIRENASDMRETIEKVGRVSDRQEQAIENWTAGVAKWFH